MRTRIFLLVAFGCFGAKPALPQAPSDNPTYSSAVFRHENPHQYLSAIEAQLSQRQATEAAPAAGLGTLAHAAKAALEAGENAKAHDYAVRALTMADQEAARLRNQVDGPDSRFYHEIPMGEIPNFQAAGPNLYN